MTTECSTENCDNPATHLDQFKNPICTECMNRTVEFGEDDKFELIGASAGQETAVICSTPDCKNTALNITEAGDMLCDKCLDFIFQNNPRSMLKSETVTDTACTYNHGHFCSCPECLRSEDNRCTDTTCQHRPAPTPAALTIFEESLTSTGLAEIAASALLLPDIAKTNDEYKQVYDFSTRLKRLRKAVKQKEKALQKELKSDFTRSKLKIAGDLEYVVKTITPLIDQTLLSRDYMECWTEALKENKARILAAKAETERTRIADEKKKRQAQRDAELSEAAEAVETERLKLKRERYEFECEKSRLDVDDAWTDSHWDMPDGETMTISEDREKSGTLSQGELDEMLGFDQGQPVLKSDYPELAAAVDEEKATDEPVEPETITVAELRNTPLYKRIATASMRELSEFANPEPAPPVETETFADMSAAGLESLKNDDSIIENAVEASGAAPVETDEYQDIAEQATAEDRTIIFETDNFSDGPASIIYSTDPTEKEKQLLDQDQPHIKNVLDFLTVTITTLSDHQRAGFESLTATTATRHLIENLQLASGQFKVAISHPMQIDEFSDQAETPDDDCPF